MKNKLAVLVAALLGLSGMLTTTRKQSGLTSRSAIEGFTLTAGDTGITAFIIVGFRAIGPAIIGFGFTDTTSLVRVDSRLESSFSRSSIS